MKSLSLFIKPASSLCNMKCRYCFYSNVSDNRAIKSYGIMREDVMNVIIDKAITELDEGGILNIAFQGGEPLVAGFEYYKSFCDYFRNKNTKKISVHYSVQTNGTLITEQFGKLFSDERFLVGVSLDGNKTYNDKYRKDSSGKGTYDSVISGIEILNKYGVDFNVLGVITSSISGHAEELFDFLKSKKIYYFQPIPCLPDLESKGDYSNSFLSPRQYGLFLNNLYKKWENELKKGFYLSIRIFDNYLQMSLGYYPEQCGIFGKCVNQLVIEADGSVYPCDFYVLDDFKCGQIQYDSYEEIMNSQKSTRFINLRNPDISNKCRDCEVFEYCRGGCKRYFDFYRFDNDYCPINDFLTNNIYSIKKTAYDLINKKIIIKKGATL